MMTNRPALKQTTISLAILLISGGLFFGLTRIKDKPKQDETSFNPPIVEVKNLAPESITLSIDSQGVVKPEIETLLVSEVSGVVKWVSPVFVSGAVFKKGEILARIDNSDYKAAMSQAEAMLIASKARLAEELAKSEAEENNWLRSGKKLKDAPDLLLRKPYVKEAKANVKAAKAQQEKAERDFSKTFIKAPYDGMVKERLLNLGEFLSPGKAIGTIFSVNYAEVRLPITSTDLTIINLPAVGRNKEARDNVQLTQKIGHQAFNWRAVIDRVEGIVDQQNRMNFLVVKISDPYGLESPRAYPLKSGSFVHAEIKGKIVDNLFRLPRNAIYGSGRILVLNQSADGLQTLNFREIDIRHADEEDVFISGNIYEGDKISITRLNNPIDGMQVNTRLVKDEEKMDKKTTISLTKD
ncbi:MAG: efflux RND transporter periplasmic adaptor subunit [Endozoicomonas sp. (ex Botrylloides leachii)]|nr:efflux RND transporter periplasmic adaptor subunit [Endozoicomonas sp. (ex Botrylloides leachii)]